MFEHIESPMTWYPDLADGVLVTGAANYGAGGTKVVLINSAPEDLILTQFLAICTSLSTHQVQFNLWTDATGSTFFGSFAVVSAGATVGDGFGLGVIEIPIGLKIPVGTKLWVSAAKSGGGTLNYNVSVGVVPFNVTGTITSTTLALKTAPDMATGVSVSPADLVGTPGAWVQILAAAAGDLLIQNFTCLYPNQLGGSRFQIDVGIGAGPTLVDSYQGGSTDNATATEGSPLVLPVALPASGLIGLGDKVSIRLAVWDDKIGASTAAWNVHMGYIDA